MSASYTEERKVHTGVWLVSHSSFYSYSSLTRRRASASTNGSGLALEINDEWIYTRLERFHNLSGRAEDERQEKTNSGAIHVRPSWVFYVEICVV